MVPGSIVVVVCVVFLALGFVVKSRRATNATTGYSLAGTWEGNLVQMLPQRPPVVAYLSLTLSRSGKAHIEVKAFFGAMPLSKPETMTGTYTYEPGHDEEKGVLEVRTIQPRPSLQKGTVKWLSPDEFVFTSDGTALRYSRVI